MSLMTYRIIAIVTGTLAFIWYLHEGQLNNILTFWLGAWFWESVLFFICNSKRIRK